ncbi:MAG TPA: cytochrome c oxidase subunit 3 family protein [Pirellulales bacterium]|nr:cytochrome c oxidase subunit 3 family protein [Pirellulales bacterium]
MSDTTTAHAPSTLVHQFDDIEQQRLADTMGMWLFLATEVLLFGGLFTTFFVYRSMHHEAFIAACQTLDMVGGGINTGVLLCSSLTMALAVHAAQSADRRKLIALLLATMVLGLAFLVIKFSEYAHKYHEHHIPIRGMAFHFDGEEHGLDAAHAEETKLFYGLYFAMTGVHAAHMFIGLTILSILLVRALRYPTTTENYMPVEISGLYWHLIDLVWIYLYPTLYLIDLH